MTYLDKFNKYGEFADAGCRLFSLPVLFSGRWISATDGFKPFARGIFDIKDKPFYGDFESSVKKILDACPDALIIPRVNMSMPLWWENENPDHVNILPDGTVKRESFYSQKWLADAGENLKKFILYAETSPAAPHIAGYQLAGGNTEEWFHFDLNGGLCKNAEKGFADFLKENYPDETFKGLPDLSLLNGKNGNFLNNAYLSHYLEYANLTVARAITHFTAIAKSACEHRVPVGVFYGYTLEVTSPLWGTHALKVVLEDENTDFICSPNSYMGLRSPDYDWTEMYPADSVRLHGKLCFQECDIRTHLTVTLHEKDPQTDPENHLCAPIWHGPETKRESLDLIRKSFCRQLIKGNGLWWFDMWGGWYSDPDIMNEMRVFRRIYEKSLESEDRSSVAQLAVFADESAYAFMTDCGLRNAAFNERRELGLTGTPYDIFDVFDFEAVHKNYKAIVFMCCADTPRFKKALALCAESAVPYLAITPEKQSFSAEELRAFCMANGIHIYIESGDILYINRDFAAVCAVTDGEKTVKLAAETEITPLLGTDETVLYGKSKSFTGSEIKIGMKKGETVLFALNKT